MSTAFAFLTVYATLNKQHLKIYHKIDGKSPQKGETQPQKKKNVAHFSALQITHNKSSSRERETETERQRQRESRRARALFTQFCLEKTAQKAEAKKINTHQRKKNRHEKEQVE